MEPAMLKTANCISEPLRRRPDFSWAYQFNHGDGVGDPGKTHRPAQPRVNGIGFGAAGCAPDVHDAMPALARVS
jgi:hypothetical protein